MRSTRSCVASVSPPSSCGPTLSPWRPPLATASPSIAKPYSASRGSGSSSSALAATSAATQEAAEPAMPEPSAMPLCRLSSKPCGRPSPARSASNAAPAVLRSASNGRSRTTPSMVAMRTTGSSMRVTCARSPAPASVWPRMSKPTPTLPTQAGAKALATLRDGSVAGMAAMAAARPIDLGRHATGQVDCVGRRAVAVVAQLADTLHAIGDGYRLLARGGGKGDRAVRLQRGETPRGGGQVVAVERADALEPGGDDLAYAILRSEHGVAAVQAGEVAAAAGAIVVGGDDERLRRCHGHALVRQRHDALADRLAHVDHVGEVALQLVEVEARHMGVDQC